MTSNQFYWVTVTIETVYKLPNNNTLSLGWEIKTVSQCHSMTQHNQLWNCYCLQMFRGILSYSHRLRCSSVTVGLSLPWVFRQIALVGKPSSPIIPAHEGDQIITADLELQDLFCWGVYDFQTETESRGTNWGDLVFMFLVFWSLSSAFMLFFFLSCYDIY